MKKGKLFSKRPLRNQMHWALGIRVSEGEYDLTTKARRKVTGRNKQLDEDTGRKTWKCHDPLNCILYVRSIVLDTSARVLVHVMMLYMSDFYGYHWYYGSIPSTNSLILLVSTHFLAIKQHINS